MLSTASRVGLTPSPTCPPRARWIAEADVAPRGNKAGSVDPPKSEGFLFLATEISQELLAAYRATEYWVGTGPDPFCLYIGQHSAPFAPLLDDSGCGCAVVISAHNPFGKPRAIDAIAESHERLRRALDNQSTVLIEGVGRDTARLWPEEKSFLAIGLPLEAARQMGKRFGQNAIV